MKEVLKNQCEVFMENREAVKGAFAWEQENMISVAASVLMSSDKKVDSECLKSCKQILKAETSIFSNFRGTVEMAVVSMMAVSDNPQAKLEKALKYYNVLKNKFMGSEYLVLAAALLTDSVPEGYIDNVATRAKNIYKMMQEDHPFLTSGEDSVMAAMMAVSEKADDKALVDESEAIYQNLRNTFSIGNDLQAVAFVLALADGAVESKCEKMVALFEGLKAAGAKYGKSYELSTLAALSILPAEVNTMVEDVVEMDAYLAEYKPYKGIFGMDRKTRLMHAAMLVSGVYSKNADANIAAVTGTMAMIAAQQAALCAAICATTAANAAASSSH